MSTLQNINASETLELLYGLEEHVISLVQSLNIGYSEAYRLAYEVLGLMPAYEEFRKINKQGSFKKFVIGALENKVTSL